MSEEELPEARVPTHLVRNQVHILGDGPIGGALFDVGPYRVLRGLVRAPQAWLVEATGPAGDRAILHLVHCRAVRSRAEELERQAFQTEIATATVGLFDEIGFTVQAHGHVQREDGSRVLFWALPWHDGALHLNAPGSSIRDVEHLLDVAVALADRVGVRHELDRLEPLMSEQLVAVSPHGAELLGVPLFIPPSWLAPEMPSCRMAPEEMANLFPSRIGDIWRLGQALTALASRFEAIPSALSNLLRWMTHEDPKKRPPRAMEVRVECASIKERLSRAHLTRPQPAVQRPSLSFEEVSQLIVATLGPTGELDIQSFKHGLQVLHGEDEVTLAGSVNVKALDKPPSPTGVPPWAFFFSALEYERFVGLIKADLDGRRVGHRLGTGVVQLIAEDGAELEYLGLSEVARACFRADPTSWADLIAKDFSRQIGETAETVEETHKQSAQRARRAAASEEPTQRISEKHLLPSASKIEPALPERDPETDPPTEPPGPKPKVDRVTITVGDAVDLHAIVEKNETIPDRQPAIVGPNPTSPYAGTLPSQNPFDARVPDSLRQEPVAQAPADELPFQETLPSPAHPNRVPDDLRAQAQANLHGVPQPDLHGFPKTGTIAGSGPMPPSQMRALAFPRPQMPVTPALIPKGYTMPAQAHQMPHPAPQMPQVMPPPADVPRGGALIEGSGTLDPSMAAAAKGNGIRNSMVALLLILTVGAIIGAIVFAERPATEEATRQFTEVTLDGEIILRADPPNAVVVGEDDGRILGQAPLRFLLASGAEVGVIIASPGRIPKRVALNGAGEIKVALDPLPEIDIPCQLPFEGAPAKDLGGVIGNMKVDENKLEFNGASVVRTKPGSRNSGAWIVRCPLAGIVETIELEPRPIEPAELRISKPVDGVAYVEGQAQGMIPVSLTVPEAFTKIAIDAGHGARGPLWVLVRGPTDIAIGSVPDDLVRELKEERPAEPARPPQRRKRKR